MDMNFTESARVIFLTFFEEEQIREDASAGLIMKPDIPPVNPPSRVINAPSPFQIMWKSHTKQTHPVRLIWKISVTRLYESFSDFDLTMMSKHLFQCAAVAAP